MTDAHKLDLCRPEVELIELTASDVRQFFDYGLPIGLIDDRLDTAQGHVFSGEYPEAYVVIRIVKGDKP